MLDYSLRLGFILGNRLDPRFDPLTPPPNLFDDLPLGFYITFRNDTFEFMNADRTKSVGYLYDQTIVSLIESLEAGLIDRELSALLRKQLHIESWEDGRIVCQITDCRFQRPIGYRQILRVIESTVLIAIVYRARYGRSVPTLEVEQQVLTVVRRALCIDPSPDVARAQSVADWRMKMWRRRRELHKGILTIAPEILPVCVAQGNVTLIPLVGTVVIPDPIFQMQSNGVTVHKNVKGE